MSEPATKRTPPDDTTAPVAAEGLRERVAALFRHAPGTERPGDKTPGEIADLVLAELAGDLGDLPARMLTAARDAGFVYDRSALIGFDWDDYLKAVIKAVVSVRWKDHAATVARLAQAEAHAEHAEGELSSLRDHRARWETEHAEVERLQAELAAVLDHDGEAVRMLNAAEADLERLAALTAERDLLRETLAESDLGAQVLAQWEAIAAADADRDRLEVELAEAREKLSDAVVKADAHFTTYLETVAQRDALKAELAKALKTATGLAEDRAEVLVELEDTKAAIEQVRAIRRPPGIKSISSFGLGRDDGWNQALAAVKDALAAPESDEAGEQWAKRLADASLAAARAKFGPDSFPEGVEDAPVEAPVKHVGGRVNAEDCPACSGTNPPYRFICPGEPEGERNEYVTCSECGSEPTGNYPVAHKPRCSRMTIAPHLWPSPDAPTEETDHER